MPEILTESFCERCGTRYTFESAVPRAPRLKGIKVMSRGLKNFVMSDDTSMDEAMAAARSETDREVTSHQLDAFHKTFNFCMTCRQYTCSNCWNDAEGRCLTCAPHLGQEILTAPFPDLDAHGGFPGIGAAETNGHAHVENGHEELPAPLDAMAWPTSDLMREEEEAAAAVAEPEPAATFETSHDEIESTDLMARLAALGVDAPASTDTAIVEAEVEAETAVTAEPVLDEAFVDPELVAADVESEAAAVETGATDDAEEAVAGTAADHESIELAQIDAGDVDGRAAAAAAQTSQLLARFRPGQSLDAELEAFERELAPEIETAVAAEVTPEPVEPEPVVAAEPEPVAVEPEPVFATEPEPEPVAAEPEPVVAIEPESVFADEPEPVFAEPEPVFALEPELATAEPEPVFAIEPEPVAAEPEPVSSPEPEPVAATPPPVDVVAQPTWQIVAPDAPAPDLGIPPGQPAQPSLPAEPISASAEPEWPAQPQWPTERPAAGGLPFLNRPAAASGGMEALWAESAREVTSMATGPAAKATGGVQPCVSCGLSLSANARFCRRCGTRQG